LATHFTLFDFAFHLEFFWFLNCEKLYMRVRHAMKDEYNANSVVPEIVCFMIRHMAKYALQ